jgi:hypothetical protein
MRYIYYVDGEKFITDSYDAILVSEISSPDENTPAYEVLETGQKLWCEKGWRWHRLTGPARICFNGRDEFWLNDKLYENIQEWLKEHPNPDLYFHNIGVFTETDKIIWYLQN